MTAFCKFLGNIEEVVPEDVNRFLATCPSNHDVQLQRKHLLHAHFKLNFDPVLPYDILSPNVAAHAINNVDLELRSRVMLYLRFKCNKSFVTLCRMHCGEMSLPPPLDQFLSKGKHGGRMFLDYLPAGSKFLFPSLRHRKGHITERTARRICAHALKPQTKHQG